MVLNAGLGQYPCRLGRICMNIQSDMRVPIKAPMQSKATVGGAKPKSRTIPTSPRPPTNPKGRTKNDMMPSLSGI